MQYSAEPPLTAPPLPWTTTPAHPSWLKTKRLSELDAEDFVNIKRRGFSDAQIARLTGAKFENVI